MSDPKATPARFQAPPERLSILRILLGAFACFYTLFSWSRLTSVAHFAAWEFSPVGVVNLLRAPLPPALVPLSVLVTLALGVGFTLGQRFRLSGPLFALSLLWVMSYRNSWGMIFHTENLLVLQILVVGFSPAADALSLDARSGRSSALAWGRPGFVARALARARREQLLAQTRPPHPESVENAGRSAGFRYGFPIWLLCALTVITYTLAGIAKLKLGGDAWFGGELLRGQVAYDTLRKIELGSGVSPLGVWAIHQRWLFAPFAMMTLGVELGAGLALVNQRLARLWSIAAFGFHLGVLLLMSIGFIYQLAFMPYLPFFKVERSALARFLRRRFERDPNQPSARAVS